jgi:chromosomal replication initiator protein
MTDITMQDVKRAVAMHFKLPTHILNARNRNNTIVYPRMLAMLLCREICTRKPSLNQVGKSFGWRDHTTVMNAEKKMSQMIKDDPFWRDAYTDIRQELLFTRSSDGQK